MVRIAFVNLQLSRGLSGVNQAIAGQVAAARASSLPIDFIVLNQVETRDVDGVRFVQFEDDRLRSARFFKSRLIGGVRELDAYDVVLLRYPLAIDLDPLALFRRQRAKIVTVHHTKEIPELLSQGHSAGAVGRAALEWVNGRRFLRRVDGIAAVTDEIRQYELARAGLAKPSRTIANGIDVRRVLQTGFAPFDGEQLRMVFIASAHAPWHGTDRLLESLRRYRGSVRLHLHMVGAASGPLAATEATGPLTIQHHGTLHGPALDDVFRDSTLAFSSLAMFRNGLRQACVLKTREYVARGMPFVYGYDDVDLEPGLPFCLDVGNVGIPFDVESIIDFAAKVSRHAGLSAEMRAFAEQRLDWRVKMRGFYELALEVA